MVSSFNHLIDVILAFSFSSMAREEIVYYYLVVKSMVSGRPNTVSLLNRTCVPYRIVQGPTHVVAYWYIMIFLLFGPREGPKRSGPKQEPKHFIWGQGQTTDYFVFRSAILRFHVEMYVGYTRKHATSSSPQAMHACMLQGVSETCRHTPRYHDPHRNPKQKATKPIKYPSLTKI
jgi:hypothetical protein